MSSCVNFVYENSWFSRIVRVITGVHEREYSDSLDVNSGGREGNFTEPEPSELSQAYVSDIYPFIIPDSIMMIIHERLNEENITEPIPSFKSEKFVKSYCDICCIENKDGVLLKCCQEKQFICFRCFMDMLIYQNSKHRQITPELISYTGIYMLENFKVNCPYCNQPTSLSKTECISAELLKTLYNSSQTFFNYRKNL